MKSIFEEIFEINENSPSGLVWRCDLGYGRKKGDAVGCVMQYVRCEHYKNWRCALPKSFCEKHRVKRNQLVHRIIAAIHYGDEEIVGKPIDHLDGNALNNKIENLKICEDSRENNINAQRHRNNTTNVNGVSFEKLRNSYRADAPQCKPKSFSINKYGKEEAFRLACEAREQMILDLKQRGIEFSERHGK